jgi:carbon-monoxide dehydrogenase catalytic subunit
VIVLTTGCNAMACGKAGLLTPESAKVYCGPGLAEVCETVGIPPVLHMGSCVDNSRILMAATEVVKAGGLGKDISDLPAAGSAPEWMSEKAISIGHYFVAIRSLHRLRRGPAGNRRPQVPKTPVRRA